MTKQQVLEACINKQLAVYEVTYEDVKKEGRYAIFKDTFYQKRKYLWGLISGWKKVTIEIPWYIAYTFTSEQEYQEWKEFCINLFRKELKLTKKKAEQQFMWLDLNYGLKQNYLLNELPK